MKLNNKYISIGILVLIILLTILFNLGTTSKEVSTYLPPFSSQTAAVSGSGSGLIAHYTFDGNTNDSAGSNNGTANGGPTYVAGKIGQAMQFDGNNDVVATQSDFIGTGALTVCAWIKPSFTTANGSIITNYNRYNLTFSINNDLIAAYGSGSQNIVSANNSIVANKWQHACATRDSSGIGSIYIDGSVSGSPEQNGGTPVAGLSSVSIGARIDGTIPYSGAIDDVRIYNRVLTIQEIQEVYALGGGSVPDPDPEPDPNPQPTTYTLTVSKSGSGTVTGTGISCGSDCTETLNSGTSITLTAVPASGYTFSGWSGGNCSGVGTCTVNLTSNTTVTATFTAQQQSGGTINAISCNNTPTQPHVQNAINSATDGAVVVIPAGTCTWTQGLTITKAITLQGSGVGQTIIRDAITNGAIIVWNLVSNRSHRLTGIEFRDGGRPAQNFHGTIQIFGNGSLSDTATMRIDHNDFENLLGAPNIQLSNVIGVADHNTYSGVPTNRFVNVYNGNWDGGGQWGDKSYTDGNRFGTDKFFFFENNTLTYNGPDNYAFFDSWIGGRFVVRYNTLINGSFQVHGTESSNRYRSARAVEIYNNTFIGNNTNAYSIYIRGGVALVHNNTVTGYTNTPEGIVLAAYRANPGTWVPWGPADGTNQWDLNSGGVLREVLDQPGRSGGSLITGDTPILPWPAGQNNQVDDPGYEWNNIVDGKNMSFTSGHPAVIRPGEHYVNDTCKPGYTPYTYPHPLTGLPAQSQSLNCPGTQPPPPLLKPGDLNNDGSVNSLDFSLLTSRWNQNYPAYDLNGDGTINSLDFSVMAQNWTR